MLGSPSGDRKTRNPTAVGTPKVFAVLLNWNTCSVTLKCVRSLQEVNYERLQIVIVENGSAGDDARTLQREVGKFCHLIVLPENLGYAEGNNVGARYALEHDADYLLVLNNDAIIHPDSLARMVEVAENNESVGILSPTIGLITDEDRIVFPRRVHCWSSIAFFHVGTIPMFEILKSPPLESVRRVGTVDGCCFLAKRQVVEQVGLFDSRYFFGGYESLDLVLRAERLGYLTVIVPDAHIWADRGDRRLKSLAYSYWSPRNRVIFANSSLPPKHLMLFWLTLPFYIVSWILVWGVRGARVLEVASRISRGIRDGLKASRSNGHLT